ncbi:copper transporter [Nocardiopsis sp. CNT312]|uniref:copper transporter n=1 Tax=Nocardiopsis sp. CNT312 TaxID=1137268 RepID=UPI00048EF735|nr:copper transporter [Nocardiopsis sp. CNT312]
MIDFRYHLVSIVAVFLALTVGIVLGTTMLQDPLLDTLQAETSDLRVQSEELRVQRDAADQVALGADQLAEALSGDVLGRRLDGLGVAVVAAPGADADVVAALADRVAEADGEIVGRIDLTPDLVEHGSASFVAAVARRAFGASEQLSGTAYEQAGAVLGRALADVGKGGGTGGTDGDDEAGSASDGPSASEPEESAEPREADGGAAARARAGAVLDDFAEHGLIALHGEPAGAADTVVVVAPAAPLFGSDGDSEAVTAALVSFVTALGGQVGPTVLAGDAASAQPGGLIARVRSQESALATVDLAGRPVGDVITVLALADALEGAPGAYGVGEGAAGFAPVPLPGPRPRPVVEPSAVPSAGAATAGGLADGTVAQTSAVPDDPPRAVEEGE